MVIYIPPFDFVLHTYFKGITKKKYFYYFILKVGGSILNVHKVKLNEIFERCCA